MDKMAETHSIATLRDQVSPRFVNGRCQPPHTTTPHRINPKRHRVTLGNVVLFSVRASAPLS